MRSILLFFALFLFASCASLESIRSKEPLFTARYSKDKKSLISCFSEKVFDYYENTFSGRRAPAPTKFTVFTDESDVYLINGHSFQPKIAVWNVAFHSIGKNITDVKVTARKPVFGTAEQEGAAAIEQVKRCGDP